MCGITGIISAQALGPEKLGWLERMNAALRHRGPDSSGLYVDGQVALAMRRLSIIDLPGGSALVGPYGGQCADGALVSLGLVNREKLLRVFAESGRGGGRLFFAYEMILLDIWLDIFVRGVERGGPTL